MSKNKLTPAQRLLRRLDLKAAGTDEFIGGAGSGGVTANARLYGGLVAAQASMAALRSVDNGTVLHSLHAYFLRPGRAEQDIRFQVTRSKEGRNFSVRQVDAWQADTRIFQLQASFQQPEPGVERSPQMPEVAAPDTLPNRDQLRGRENWQQMPIDVRMVSEITADQPLDPNQQVWLKSNTPLTDETDLHFALTVYASDRSLLDTAWRPHADQGELSGASLDHSMWFHHTPNFDDWLLYDMASYNAAGARGLAFGHMFDCSGRCIVTTAQEGLLRIRQR